MKMGSGTGAMSGMDMATSTGVAMAASTSSSSMGDGSTTSMNMQSMTMTFFESVNTPLFSTSWTPSSTGQYAGTCIFLIVLALVLRVMLALRPILEASVWREGERSAESFQVVESTDKSGLAQSYGFVAMRAELRRRWHGWRATSATGRACYELVIAGIGYLLMIAVMTMNVGYFCSVIAGVFLGTFVLGSLAGAGNLADRC